MKRSLSASRRKQVAGLLAFGLLASACVHQGGPKVGVAKLEANLVFGVQESKKPTGPPAVATGPVIPDVPPAFSFPEPPSLDVSNPAPPKPLCPQASVTAAPLVPTEAFVTGPPPVGLFKWKRGGTVTTASGAKAAFTGYEGRVVRNYKTIDANNFEFQTVQPRLDAEGLEISSFHVKTNGQTVQSVGTNGVPTVRVPAPDAGLVLTKIEKLDKNGTKQGEFAPGQGLLLLPLPVTTGEQFSSVAIDAKNGETMQNNGTVTRRQRVDACGELVDGWEVQSQLTDSFAGQLTYNYIVATQYGAMLISEAYQPAQATSATGPTPAPPGTAPFSDDINFQLAQLKPGDVPASFNP
jgi:hypothetical protein